MAELPERWWMPPADRVATLPALEDLVETLPTLVVRQGPEASVAPIS